MGEKTENGEGAIALSPFGFCNGRRRRLARIELDDQRNVADDGDEVALGDFIDPHARHVAVERQVRDVLGIGKGFLDARQLLALGLDADKIAGLASVTWHINTLAIDENVAVGDKLAGGIDGARQTAAQDDGIQAHFQHLQEIVAGVALLALGLVEIVAQLALMDVVLSAQLLLFHQLAFVVRQFAAEVLHTTMRTGWVRLGFHDFGRFGGQGDPQ